MLPPTHTHTHTPVEFVFLHDVFCYYLLFIFLPLAASYIAPEGVRRGVGEGKARDGRLSCTEGEARGKTTKRIEWWEKDTRGHVNTQPSSSFPRHARVVADASTPHTLPTTNKTHPASTIPSPTSTVSTPPFFAPLSAITQPLVSTGFHIHFPSAHDLSLSPFAFPPPHPFPERAPSQIVSNGCIDLTSLTPGPESYLQLPRHG